MRDIVRGRGQMRIKRDRIRPEIRVRGKTSLIENLCVQEHVLLMTESVIGINSVWWKLSV